MNPKKNQNKYLYAAGSLCVFIGAALKVFDVSAVPGVEYLFTAGVAMLLVQQISQMAQNKSADKRLRRHGVNLLFATIVLAVGCYYMINGSNEWIVTTLIYGVVTMFLSFRDPEAKK